MMGIKINVKLLLNIFDKIINLGKNPVKGGKPPNDNKLIEVVILWLVEFLNKLESLLKFAFFRVFTIVNIKEE